ncbi:MAG: 1-deoxy-D-xylulose-5-phosphate reductoisomerase [Acutalibacteraceae bacterium]
MKKNLSVLGSTGSIGTQTLEVARTLGITVNAISANTNIDLLEKQIREFKPKIAAVYDEENAKILKESVKDTNTKILSKIDGLCEVASYFESDLVVTAVSGMIGLLPTLSAIKAKKDIALANKETLVVAGEYVINAAKEKNVKILPVDSEHSAIFQCLESCKDKNLLKKLILTASGGPFFGKSKKDLENVTVNQALNHPSWKMGSKITIDSATMMNKGFEIIEAIHLFDMPENKIDVIIHPQSVVHSMIEYVDNSIIAQMGVPSMKTPIAYAITYPERKDINVPELSLSQIKNMSFFEPDHKTFEAIKICKKAAKDGGTSPAIINAANEEAVKMFLENKIKFTDIINLIKKARENIQSSQIKSINDVLLADKITREFIKSIV